MSARFIAHVERPDGRVHHIDCDAAHENDAGRLALTSDTQFGAVACYAPGAWVSYVLEAAPTRVTLEQVQRGEKSTNDYRRSLGVLDTPSPAMPTPGSLVHVVRRADNTCEPWYVTGYVGATALLLSAAKDDETADQYTSGDRDDSATTIGSWHWPHDGQDQTPRPDPSGPVTVNVTVQGSVLTDRDLAKQIRKVINADWARNRVSPSQMRY